MCAINPAHHTRFVLDVYTSHNMTESEFEELSYGTITGIEVMLNEHGKLRWHFSEENCKSLDDYLKDGWKIVID